MVKKILGYLSKNQSQSKTSVISNLSFHYFVLSRSLLRFGIEKTPSPKMGHLLAEEEFSDDEAMAMDTSRM